jgi:hypothetical protein
MCQVLWDNRSFTGLPYQANVGSLGSQLRTLEIETEGMRARCFIYVFAGSAPAMAVACRSAVGKFVKCPPLIVHPLGTLHTRFEPHPPSGKAEVFDTLAFSEWKIDYRCEVGSRSFWRCIESARQQALETFTHDRLCSECLQRVASGHSATVAIK